MIRIIDYKDIDRAEILDRKENVFNVADTVSEIIRTVREKGDEALFGYCEKFDRVKLSSLEVSAEEIDEAFALVEPEFVEILKEAKENIYAFHSRQVRNSFLINEKDGVVIGQTTAEDIKIQIGQVYPRHEERSMNVKGRDAKTGLPKEVTLLSSDIFEVLRRPARQIADEVLSVLEETSPELVSDIARNGITLTGGSSQIWGMDLLLTERTGIRCTLADDPDSCVAYGCGKSLAWINHMQEGPINIARKRIMRG